MSGGAYALCAGLAAGLALVYLGCASLADRTLVQGPSVIIVTPYGNATASATVTPEAARQFCATYPRSILCPQS